MSFWPSNSMFLPFCFHYLFNCTFLIMSIVDQYSLLSGFYIWRWQLPFPLTLLPFALPFQAYSWCPEEHYTINNKCLKTSFRYDYTRDSISIEIKKKKMKNCWRKLITEEKKNCKKIANKVVLLLLSIEIFSISTQSLT